ncbi:DUF1254 domain-containing protein [Nocardia sp. NPDC050406]|uniref:DUF1254 domain-containing protein n=1 Tax=Nocardia sp. NPDC050406 TaxID=3364318 RepID=UPI0037A7B3B8
MKRDIDAARVSRRTVFELAAVTAGAVALTACGKSDGGAADDDPKAIATDAYVFGYPLVLMDATRAAAQARTPVNHFQHARQLPTPERRDVVRLNLDTLYSIAWLDLSAEPLVLQIPAVAPDRYWLMQLMDAWTNTVHNPGSERPQVKLGVTAPPYTYAVTGPGWQGELPDGVTQLAMPTPTVWLLGRIQVNGEADIPAVAAIQDEMKLVPLRDWTAGTPAPVAPTVPADTATPPAEQIANMKAETFFEKLCALMATNPPAPEDAPVMARFAEIGITPGGAVTGLSPEDLTAAAAAGLKRIPTYQDPGMKHENGWQFTTDLGAYGINYALRALVAMRGLGANLARDAVYPSIFGTADDKGTPNRYRLHFPAGQTPPVRAFWSLTAYDGDSYLVANPAGIHAIGHLIPPVLNSDGSLDITVQHADPGSAVPHGNWLPIPASGTFSLTMRLYAPEESVLTGAWRPPALREL